MKLLLVMGSDDTSNLISLYIKPLGFELIRYHYVLKAMDNIDEADPSAIIISARDFPRHWKTMVQFVRSERPKDLCPIILLKGNNFPLEETSKAFYLGVSGIVDEALNDSAEINRLQNILSRYIPLEEKRRARRYQAKKWQRLNFVFAGPKDKTIVTGEVKTISTGGLSFYPEHPAVMKDIWLNTELAECSLRVGDKILSPVCRLARTGRIVSMEFVSFPREEEGILEKYLESLPLEELKHKKQTQQAHQ
ncbi:MAG: PilZ domain-containing protein [Treponema sp.]|nr:PilZ domain-containing protein [Treponema sp.]